MIMREAPARGPGSQPDYPPSSRGGHPPGRNPYDVLPSLDAPFSPAPPVVAHVTQPTPPPSARGNYGPAPSSGRGQHHATPPPGAAQSGGYAPYPFQSPQPPHVQPQHSQMPLPPGVPNTGYSAPPRGIPQTMRPQSAFPSAMRRSSRPPPANLPLPSTYLPQPQAPGSFVVPALLLGGPLLLAMLVIAVLALA